MLKKGILSLAIFTACFFFAFATITSAYGDGFGVTSGSMPLHQSESSQNCLGKGVVGSDGGVHYRLPLGFVTASYSSNAPKSSAWAIAQASLIQRDTKWGVPTYSDQDIFLLDGQELAYESGLNPRVYHTKDEMYCRIEYFNPGSISSYWRVTDKSGHVRYYGETEESRIIGIGKSAEHPRVWSITREVESFEITRYRYENDSINGSYYLSSVIKGKAASLEFAVTRVFYETSADQSISYRTGSLVRTSKRVATIVEAIGCDSTGIGGALVRAYEIDWTAPSANSNASLVSTITEYGSDATVDVGGHISGTALAPTVFTYSNINPSYGTAVSWATTDAWYIRTADSLYDNFDLFDLDGDGRADRIKQGHDDTGWAENWDPSFRFQLSTGNGFLANSSWNSEGVRLRQYTDSSMTNCTYDYFDVNGDGLPDRVWQSGTTFYFRLNSGTGFGSTMSLTQSVGNYLHSRTSTGDETYTYLDINGDGWVDRVWQAGESVFHAKIANPNTGQFGPIEHAWPSNGLYLRQGDESGNGIYDYLDMNGDGLVDRVWQENSAILNIRFGNGSGFENTAVQWSSSGSYLRKAQVDSSWMSTYTASDYRDFNSDGLPDRMVQDNSATLTVLLNTGNGFGAAMYYSSIGNYLLQPIYRGHIYDYVDMDGNGVLDRVYHYGDYFHPDRPYSICLDQSANPVESYLTHITTPARGEISYSYKIINHELNPHYRLGYRVVYQQIVSDDLGNSEASIYDFEGGKFDVETRTDKGFRIVRCTTAEGDKQETYYHQEGTLEGQVEKTIRRTSGGAILSYIYNTYNNYAQNESHYGHGVSQARTGSGPAVAVRATRLVETLVYKVDGTTTVDLGNQPFGAVGVDWIRSRTTYQYDDWGSITLTEQGDYTSGNWGNDKKETYTEFINDNFVYWRFVRKRSYTRQFDHLGAQQQSSESKYYYDSLPYGQVGGTGLLSRTEQYYDLSHFIVTTREYDSYGNLWKTTDGRGNTTTYSYDSRFHAYLVGTTTPEISSSGGIQLTTSVEYDSLMRPYRSIDVNGIVSEKRYDLYGRTLKEIAPEDSENLPTVTMEYHQADGSADADGTPCGWTVTRNRVRSGDAESLSVFTYYDGLGRVVQSKEQSVDTEGFPCWKTVNHWEFVEGTHRVSVHSLPFISSNNVFSRPVAPTGQFVRTDTYCDLSLGRIKKVTEASGAVTYQYEKHYWVKSIDAKGQEVASESIPAASEKRVYTYEGTYPNQSVYRVVVTIETFDSTMITVKDISGNPLAPPLEVFRDWLSRKTECKDPDMGRWTYHYDDCGNLISQTDNMRQETLFEYDELNRLKTKTFSDSSIINYFYDVDYYVKSGVNNYARSHLTKVLYASGQDLYIYDTRGRIQWQNKTIDGHVAEMGKTFDAMNRQTSEIYPDGEVVTYAYDDGGNLNLVQGTKDLSTTTYVSNISYTPFGKMSSFQYGNGIQTGYDYYDSAGESDPSSGMLYSYRLKEISSSVLDLKYEYDQIGNIKKKYLDLGQGFELYSYDTQNRLVSSSSELYGSLTFVYDRLNNIVQKDGRTYAYGACQTYTPPLPDPLPAPQAGPHAATNDGTYSYEYDLNGNMKVRSPIGQGPVRTLSYDADNHLTTVADNESTLANFSYDSDGNRIKKTEGLCSTFYFFPAYEEEINGSSVTMTKYYFANGQRVAQRVGTNVLQYLHSDHLNSVVRITNVDGQLIRLFAYKPFGEDVYSESSVENENLQLTGTISGEYVAARTISLEDGAVIDGTTLLRAGSTISFKPGSRVASGASLVVRIEPSLLSDYSVSARYQFTGQERESSGLYFYGARFYDPILGRFVQPDSVLDGLNRYTYCGNNPVKYCDPTGNLFGIDDFLFWFSVLLGSYIGGAVVNDNLNPFEWDYSSPRTWFGIVFGGFTGGLTTVGLEMLLAGESGSILFNDGGVFFHIGPRYDSGQERGIDSAGGDLSNPSREDLNTRYRELYDASYENQDLWSLIRTLYDVNFPTAFFDLEMLFPIAEEDLPKLSSDYGFRLDPFENKILQWHPAWDIAAKKGTYILAAHSGYVHLASDENFGKNITVTRGFRDPIYQIKTQYSHMSEFLVKEGQWVNKGERIGKVGSTGYSTGPHLDFRVFIGTFTVNPRRFFFLH